MKGYFFTLSLIFLSSAFSHEKEKPTPQYELDYKTGLAAEKNQNYHKAIKYYLKAVNQRSDLADVWNHLGDCHRLIAKEYLAKAGAAYFKALQYTPDHEEALECQGECFVMMGQLKKAYRNYQALKTLDSKRTIELKEKLDAFLKPAQWVLEKYDLPVEEK